MFQIKRYPNFGPFFIKKASYGKNTRKAKPKIDKILKIAIKKYKKVQRGYIVWSVSIV
jgi:hypothetical protein